MQNVLGKSDPEASRTRPVKESFIPQRHHQIKKERIDDTEAL